MKEKIKADQNKKKSRQFLAIGSVLLNDICERTRTGVFNAVWQLTHTYTHIYRERIFASINKHAYSVNTDLSNSYTVAVPSRALPL